MKIDIHTHVIPPETLGKAGKKYGPKFLRGRQGTRFLQIGDEKHGPIPEEIFNLEKRIESMDRANVDIQILSIVPFTFFYWINSKTSLKYSEIQNNAVAKIVDENPNRFVGLATVPLQSPKEAVTELSRAVKQLGLRGVEISSNVKGKNLDWRELWPFYEKAQELDVPILVHPPSSIRVAAADRLQRYYLINLIGNPLDTSIAIASVIFGGVMEQFSDLKICFVHAGGFIPYIRGRLEHGFKVRSEPKVKISYPPSEYLKLLYFDTVSHYTPALLYLIETIGVDRVLMGSDYPFDMGDPNPVSTIKNLELDSVLKKKILGKNAARFFRIS